MCNAIPLTDLPRALIEAQYEPPASGYRGCYTAAVDGRIPARRGKNGRWTFDPADLPTIAPAMGLTDAHAA